MGNVQWLMEHWGTALNAIGIVGGLFFSATSLLITAVSLRSDRKTRQVSNLLTMTANHREVWSLLFNHPELARVLDKSINFAAKPITTGEREFVTMVILHVSSVFEALKDDLLDRQQGLRVDVCSFFSLPIPRAIWNEIKKFQNDDFVHFINSCLP